MFLFVWNVQTLKNDTNGRVSFFFFLFFLCRMENEDDLVSFAPEDDNFSKAPDPEDVFFANEQETSPSSFTVSQTQTKVLSSRYIPILPKDPNQTHHNNNNNNHDHFSIPRPRKRRGENVYKCKYCGQLKKRHLCKQLNVEKSTQTQYNNKKKKNMWAIIEKGDRLITVKDTSHSTTTTNKSNNDKYQEQKILNEKSDK